MTEERVLYSDAQGVRITPSRLVFGKHTYATRNVSDPAVVRSSRPAWPAYVMLLSAVGLVVWAVFFSEPAGYLLAVAAVASAAINMFRTRRGATYYLRLVTKDKPVLVLASRDRAYVEDVMDAVQRVVGGR